MKENNNIAVKKKIDFLDLVGMVSSNDKNDSVKLQRMIRKGEKIDFF